MFICVLVLLPLGLAFVSPSIERSFETHAWCFATWGPMTNPENVAGYLFYVIAIKASIKLALLAKKEGEFSRMALWFAASWATSFLITALFYTFAAMIAGNELPQGILGLWVGEGWLWQHIIVSLTTVLVALVLPAWPVGKENRNTALATEG